MAHVEKYAQCDVVGLAIHYERREGCELSNKDIDLSRTHENYNLAQELQPLRTEQYLKQRLSEVHHMKRKDVKVMVDWIVTLPKNVPAQDERKFFELTYQFLKDEYGEKNVIGAWVHKDERTPHIHFSFLPIIIENDTEKLICKKVITRQKLKNFHPRLEKYLEKYLGYLPEILNDATINGNRTVKELKMQEDISLKKAIKNVDAHLKASENLISKANKIDFEPSSFIEKGKTLKKCNQIIDELKHSNKLLQSDTKSLSDLVIVQKEEIESYRKMPLAKQLKEKEETIDNLHVSLDSLEKQVRMYKDDNEELLETKYQLENKVESLEDKLFVHKSFLSMLGIEKIFEEFRKEFTSNNFKVDIRYLKDVCHEVLNKITKMFGLIKDRITMLDKRNIENENVNVNRLKKNITRNYER